MSLGNVLIAAPVHPVLTEGLRRLGYALVSAPDISQEQARSLIADCVGVITSTRIRLDAELMDLAPGLRWIGRMGSGMEVIDVKHAVKRGIACFSSPEGNANAVAEHALGMLLAHNKRIAHSWDEVRRGLWLRDENRGSELEGKTIGIIGFGHTGSALARKLQGMDMEILAYDIKPDVPMPAYVKRCDSLQPIFEHACFLSFHVPIGPGTYHYFNDGFITQMRQQFVLINTSRGTVVDVQALWRGLQSGKVKGACLDVWEQEPMSRMDAASRGLLEQMLALPQVLVTPHIAGYSQESLYKMSRSLLEKVTNK